MMDSIIDIEALINQAVGADPERSLSTRFKVQTTKDALAPREPRRWIVEQLFHAGSVNVAYGKSGHKKSVALVDLAVCITQGKEWLGRKTERKPVIWIDEDNGDYTTKERIDFALNGHLASDHEELYFMSLQEFDAGNPNDLEELRKLIYATNAGAVFMDALQDISPGKAENVAEEMRPIFSELRKIAEETGVAIIIIHHANKAGEDFRGSTAIEGKTDVMLKIFSEPKTNSIRFTTTKQRSIKYQEFYAQVNFVEMANGKFQTRLTDRDKPENVPDEKKLTGKQNRVLEYLLEHGDAEERTILAQCDISRGVITNLKQRNLIVRSNDGQQGNNSIVALTSDARRLIHLT